MASSASPVDVPMPPSHVVDGIPVDNLRLWAQQALLETPSQAFFYASLVYSKTALPSDALALAQAALQAGNIPSCLRVLEESGLLSSPHHGVLLAAQALAQQHEWQALIDLLEEVCRLPNAPAPLEDGDDLGWQFLQQTVEGSLIGRICHWRATAYYESGNATRATLFWKRTLTMNPHHQAAWECLLSNHLLTPTAAFNFLEEMDFREDLWLKALYMARIDLPPCKIQGIDAQKQGKIHSFSFGSRMVNLDASAIPLASPLPNFATWAMPAVDEDSDDVMVQDTDKAFSKIWNDFDLKLAPYVLALAARRAYRRYQWNDCLQYAEQLAQVDPSVTGAACCYVSALVTVGHKQSLFKLGHDWVEANPKSATAWFAVGAYYYACQRYHVAQRHFCRATRLDPHLTEAWIGFGCAFAACDESDQALASFRAAQRLSPGEHVSLLYMGMEYVRTNHLVLAQHFLLAALQASGGGDPLCLAELGVLYLQKNEPTEAIPWFERALQTVTPHDSYWEPVWFNLSHCYRKTRQYDQAVDCLEQCRGLCPQRASTYTALAMVKQLQNKLEEAIDLYHIALSIKSDDAVSSEMLLRALSELAMASPSNADLDTHESRDTTIMEVDMSESSPYH